MQRDDANAPTSDSIEALALKAAAIGLDKKAEEPLILDVRELTSYADFFVVLSGTNERQVVAIAEGIARGLREEGHRHLGMEGADQGRWVLIDYGDFLVHVFHQEQRPIYDLEGLWADARRVEVPGAPPPRPF